MKKFLFLLLFCFTCTFVQAKGVILYGNGEEISMVLSLPNQEDFLITCDDGRDYHADLGVMYNQFSLFYIPVWNYGDYKYVLYTDKKVGKYDFTYVDLGKDEVEYLQTLYGGIPDEPELPFWDAYGGKLLILLLLVIGIAYNNKD